MEWSPRLRPLQIRKLYRFSRLGLYDDASLLEVGWGLYSRCLDVIAVTSAMHEGKVPCPACEYVLHVHLAGPAARQSASGPMGGWFSCNECGRRLLWRDCREALRLCPRCFDCSINLSAKNGLLSCAACDSSWEPRSYMASVTRRVRLPCPHCQTMLRRPVIARPGGNKTIDRELPCPACQKQAVHLDGHIQCRFCGYRRKWRSYRKSQKRRDKKLTCPNCAFGFRWLAWRKEVRRQNLVTGHPYPAFRFVRKWPSCRSQDEKMLEIDFLIQAIHGRGPLAPAFIRGTEASVRSLLDEIATQV